MANTGVLPFVRGIDFSNNDFGVSVVFHIVCNSLRYVLFSIVIIL